MKEKILIGLVLFFGFYAGSHAQNAEPVTTPTPETGDVVKISTDIIQIDISVFDARGKAIPDLKADEVEIFENGRRQTITSFTYVSSGSKGNPATTGTISETTRVRAARRTIALIVDDLSLSAESAANTRRALKKFVAEQMQDDDLVAVIGTGGGIRGQQQFTSDKAVLSAAIDQIKFRGNSNGEEGALAPIKPTDLEKGLVMGNGTLVAITGKDLADERNTKRSAADYRSGIYAAGTLSTLKQIVTGMGVLQGRKSAIFFSDGFKLTDRNEQGFVESGRIIELLKQMVDQANRSAVTVYTIDARGQQTDGIGAEDSIIVTQPRSGGQPGALDPIQEDLADRRNDVQDKQGGLESLARQTGGFLTKNTNDLSYGVARALEDQGYYLLAYSPDAETFDPKTRKFNDLQVKVSRPGATARYRSGFYNNTGAAGPKAGVATPAEQMNSVLVSPFAANAIAVSLKAEIVDAPLTGTTLVRGSLHIAASDLTFTANPDGSKKAVFEVVTATFDTGGTQVDRIAKSNTINASGAKYDKIIAQGFDLPFELQTKQSGTFQLRVAIRDTQSSKSGSASQFIVVPTKK